MTKLINAPYYSKARAAPVWEHVVNNTNLQDMAVRPDGVGVAVGYNGMVMRTTDGLTWDYIPNPLAGLSAQNLARVIWTGALFVAIGQPSRVISSPDGITWTVHNSTVLDPFALYGIAFDGTTYLAVGDKTAFKSSDLTTWTQIYSGADSMAGVIWDGAQFLAYGSYSATYIYVRAWRFVPAVSGNWSRTNIPMGTSQGSFTGAATVGGTTIFTGGPGLIYASTNGGASYSVRGVPSPLAGYDLKSTVWTGTEFLVLAGPKLVRSYDGLTWSLDPTNNDTDGYTFTKVVSSSLIYGINTAAIPLKAISETGGKTWRTLKTSQMGRGAVTVTRLTATANFGLCSFAGNRLYRTTDGGLTWSTVYSPDLGTTSGPWDCGSFICCIKLGYIYYTTDGLNWTTITLNASTPFRSSVPYAIAYNGSIVVMVGASGRINYSGDLVNWANIVAVSGAPASTMDNVFWTGSLFMTTGNGVMLISGDGVTWSRAGLGQTVAAGRSNLFTGVNFVVYSTIGKFITSPDTVTWTQRTYPGTVAISGLACNGQHVVAVSNTNLSDKGIFVSHDHGETWTAVRPPTNIALNCVAYYSGKFYVSTSVANLNFRMYSEDNGDTWKIENKEQRVTNFLRPSDDKTYLISGDATNYLESLDGGKTWISYYVGAKVSSAAFGANKHVVLSNARIYYSLDNKYSWVTGQTLLTSGSTPAIFDLDYNNGMFVAATGYYANVGSGARSSDGITWTLGNTGSVVGGNRAKYLGSNKWFLNGMNSGGALQPAQISHDNGASWSVVGTISTVNDYEYFNGLYLVASNTGSGVWTSTDLVNWTTRTHTGMGIPTYIRSSDDMVVTMNGSLSSYSYDGGITWYDSFFNGVGTPSSLIWTGSEFYSCSQAGTIAKLKPPPQVAD